MNLLDNFLKYFIINSMGLDSSIISFSQLDKAYPDLVGKKAYQLGLLKYLDIPIPDGFVITISFFKEFLGQTGLDAKIKKVEELMHPAIEESIKKLFEPIRKEIMRTHIPQNLATEIYSFYRKLCGIFKESSLNIFSSSFNDKSLFFSNIKGDANLMLKIKTIWASQAEQPVAIVVQKNIKSKIKGKIFTNDLMLNKQNLLTDDQTNQLIYFARKIQKHFYFPQEIDYVIEKGKIYVTLVKPLTNIYKEPILQNKRSQKVLIKGISINPGIVTGRVRVLRDQDFTQIKNDEIIVLSQLNTLMYQKIKKAKAIIIDAAMPGNSDKMDYRKLQIPTVEGTKNATKILRTGNVITVNGINGEIYQGGLI